VVAGRDWARVPVHLTLPPAALAKGEAAAFVVRGTAVDVDQVELFPVDAAGGLDADVLRRTQDLHPPIIRYPGGNFASGYHWRDGVGRRELRPTLRNPAWGGIEPNHVGTDEFLKLCRLANAEPQLTVNAGDGKPEDAAAWVRYCNARPDTSPEGGMRAANGHAAPYGVHIWEVGNELYGGWQIGHVDAAGNAARYVAFRDAMLQADPSILLIATGDASEFTGDAWRRCAAWNDAVLRASMANGGKPPAYLSVHPLVPLPGLTGGGTYADQYESAMAHPALLGDTLLPDLARQITEVEGSDAPTRIAATEWGIIVGGDRWWEGPNHNALAGAVFNALTLNAMLKNSDWVTLANMTALLHGGGVKKSRSVVFVDPQYYTQLLYTAARPHLPVATTTTGPGRDVPARGGIPAVANVPDVDVFAALTRDRRTLVVFAVNRHLTAPRTIRLGLQGFAPTAVSGTILAAADPRAVNTPEAPDAVHPEPFRTRAWTGAPWEAALPPHSVVVLTLQR
jgi:alpha-N-arabinofuranosidase